jgi:type I restriction enzyme S subunit
MNASLPNSWAWRNAQDCMDVRDGTHDSPKYIPEGYPLVTSKNLVNGKIDFSTCTFISKEDHDSISKRSAVDDGDILYAMIGTIGNPVVVEKCCEFSIKNVALFKFNNEDIFNRYIYHFLNSDLTKRQFDSSSRGGTQKFVSLTNIRELKIPLPPLAEQQKIAAILDAADSLRQKDQQLVEHYTALSQSLFLEMFGDPVTNPMGWEINYWKDILDIKNGKNQKAVEDLNGEYPIYGSGGNVMAYANRFICNENTVIIGRKGNINKPILIKEKFWNVDTAFGLQAKSERLSYLYLYWFCVFFNFETLNKTVTIPSLTKSDLLRITTPLPPIALQNKFSERIQLIEQQKKQAQTSLAKSEALFNSLLQRAFTGELTESLAA